MSIGSFYEKSARDGNLVRAVGVTISKNTKTTRNNETMAFITLEDKTNEIECIVFPKLYAEVSRMLVDNAILFVRGRLKISSEDKPQLICEQILEADNALMALPQTKPTAKKNSSKAGIYLKFAREGLALEDEIKTVLSQNNGTVPVYFYYIDNKKYLRAPQKLWMNDNSSTKQKLIDLLGNDNVAVVS